MCRETLDVIGASAQQSFYRRVSCVPDIEPDDFRRSAARYTERDKILVSGYQDECACASQFPHRVVGGAASSQTAYVGRARKQITEARY